MNEWSDCMNCNLKIKIKNNINVFCSYNVAQLNKAIQV